MFDELMHELDFPMYLVTTAKGGKPAGCLVGFASQSSIDPPRFVVWLSVANRTAEVARGASRLVVHVLRERDQRVAELFGARSGDDVDKFACVDWEPLADGDGEPVLSQCDWFAGRVRARIEDVGDHVGYVLEPYAGSHEHTREETLGYQSVRDVNAGHDARERRER